MKTNKICVSMDNEFLKDLDFIAEANGRVGRSGAIRLMIKEYCEQRK